MQKKLFFIAPQAYNSEIFRIIKDVAKASKRIYYVTLNKTASRMVEMLQEDCIDPRQFYFLDAVTPHLLTIQPKDNCDFIESIENLTLLAESILTGVRRTRSDTIIIDSLSSMLIYKDERGVLEFMSYILPFLERMGVDVVLFTLTEDGHKPAIGQIKMMVDESRVSEAQDGRKRGGLRHAWP